MQFLQILLQIISSDLFVGYGILSILTLGIKNNHQLYEFDKTSNKFIAFIGLIYFITWGIHIFIILNNSTLETNDVLLNRMFGPYWFGYWLQPIIWIVATQLLWFGKISQFKILRIFIILILMISIEKYMIWVIQLQRDYLTFDWSHIFTLDFFVGLLHKLIFYTAIAGVCFFTRQYFANHHRHKA